jgi:hypothetical protein
MKLEDDFQKKILWHLSQGLVSLVLESDSRSPRDEQVF